MHEIVWAAIQRSRRPNLYRSGRTILSHSRYPPSRKFHRSPVARATSSNPAPTSGTDTSYEVSEESTENSQDGRQGTIEEDLSRGAEIADATTTTQRVRASGDYPVRRAGRSKRPPGAPPIALPQWFWDRNVICVEDDVKEDADTSINLGFFDQAEPIVTISTAPSSATVDQSEVHDHSERETFGTDGTSSKYLMNAQVYNEVLHSVRAGLTLRPPPQVDIKDIIRPDTLLQCPKENGSKFLDAVVQYAATQVNADLVRVDPEDVAQIIGSYVGENVAWTWSSTSLLGYDVNRIAGRMESDKDELIEEEDDQDEFDDEESLSPKPYNQNLKALSSVLKMGFSNAKPKGIAILTPSQMFGSSENGKMPTMSLNDLFNQSSNNTFYPSPRSGSSEPWTDFKLAVALEALVDAADAKRNTKSAALKQSGVANQANSSGLIIQINEYKEMTKTPVGLDILKKLREIVKKRWHDGKNIMIIGTTTAEDAVPALSRSSIRRLQGDIVFGDHRTIFVPPQHSDAVETTFLQDEKARIRSLNLRHIEDMIRKLSETSGGQQLAINLEENLSSSTAFTAGLEESVWDYPRVHRTATTILGFENLSETVDGASLTDALTLLDNSDEAKIQWASEEQKQIEIAEQSGEARDSPVSAQSASKDKLKQIRKTCTPHEKKLLGGVIDPSDIRTTFADVRAPNPTVEALRTLTGLSLIRPEAFSYGVLATDKIPGVLLYGPPGTGKTLLAKAVAKESGATVLEVSGSEVYDMYVGEGEKNIKAIFSLAKKLSPCVVFIDEADAIFGARGDSSKRTSHRELINQFLREWDGMNELSAFIMVATNRPFDLDEAVLRRLPRRLLVDLPLEQDREAILKIHLKDEILDESVSLSALAKSTPFYSGSDLKNVCVAAALTCVREENEAASNHTGDTPYVYPPKRILTKHHFDKAMEEISASISEDMSTLSAIRKFDERYGDRKGRRKKGASLGFGGTSMPEKDSEAARVRKMDVGV